MSGLHAFLGTWSLEGRQFESPFGPDAPFRAVERYEWLKGGIFLVHRFEGKIGDADAACIEVIGPGGTGQGMVVHTYYQNGVTNVWQLREHEGGWRQSGDWKVGERSLRVRCTMRPSDDGRLVRWDYSADGVSWRMFLDLRARPA